MEVKYLEILKRKTLQKHNRVHSRFSQFNHSILYLELQKLPQAGKYYLLVFNNIIVE